MADALALALANLKTKPVDTPYGIGALTIAQNIPNMIDPYGNPWSNLAIGAGSVLTTALLGYQAREQAREENLEMQPFITSGLSATTAEEIDALLKQPGGERFGDVATELKLRLLAGQAAAAERKQELEADIVKSLATRFGIIPTELQGKIQLPASGTLTLEQQQALDLSAAQLKQKREAEEPDRLAKAERQTKEDERTLALQLGQYGAQNPVVKTYRELGLFHSELRALAKNPTRPAVDRMIVLFNKMTDPTSVTTLGEFFMAEKMQSARDRYEAQLGNLASSTPRLRQQAIDELVAASDIIIGAAGNAYNAQVEGVLQQGRELGSPNLRASQLGLPMYETPSSSPGMERLRAINSEISQTTDAAKKQQLQQEAIGIAAKLRGGS